MATKTNYRKMSLHDLARLPWNRMDRAELEAAKTEAMNRLRQLRKDEQELALIIRETQRNLTRAR